MLTRFLILLVAVIAQVSAGEWSQFLGPEGSAVVIGREVPQKWDEQTNVKWKTAIHGKAWSSPIILGGDIWLTTATEDGKELSVIRVDKQTGEITLDKKLFDIETPQFCHKFNSYASPTSVASDGRVYVTFGSPGTACLDAKSGEVIWQRTDIECNHYRSAGSSPILYQNLLIMNFDGSDHQFVLALNKDTGETVWRTPRSIDFKDLNADGEPKGEGDFRKAFATPHVATIHGKEVLLSIGAKAAYGYNPKDGKEYFRVESRICHSSNDRPTVVGDTVYYTTGWSKSQLWSFKVSPDLTASEETVGFKLDRNVPKKPIPVIHNDRIYTINDSGIATCYNRIDGEVIWTKRVGANFSASPLLVGDALYFFNEDGKTTVVSASDEYEVLAENVLDSGFMASPALDGEALILRTKTDLYRIEE